jgi:adenosylcobinamide-GDP ribazoletransferase
MSGRAAAPAGFARVVGAAVRREARLLAVALQFLTRVPLPAPLARRMGWDPGWLNDSARHFPLVGLGVGAVGAAVLAAAAALWPPPVAVGLSMAATLLLTGAFHEDGLADCVDGLGGAVDRARALAIMKDSRIGSYGALALLLVLGLKAAALAALPLGWAAAALCAAHTLSRAVAVGLIRALPYAGDPAQAKAKPLARRVSTAGCAIAFAWAAALLGTLAVLQAGLAPYALPGPRAWGAAVLAALGVGWACGRWFRRRLGGVTGDTLGAAQQLSELAVILAVLAMLGQ